MKYAIIGSDEIGTALARIFARKKIDVAIANTGGPKTLAALTEELGPSVVPQSVQDACQAAVIFLAVPFPAHKDVARQFKQWKPHVCPERQGTLVLRAEINTETKPRRSIGAAFAQGFHLRQGYDVTRQRAKPCRLRGFCVTFNP